MTEEIIKDLENYKNKIDDYKQLKRLEQERDELKKVCEKCKLFDIEKTNRDLLEQIEKLEQENEKLKKENERLKKLFQNEGITDICEACSYSSAMEAYDYHKALEEIKIIAEDTFHCCDDDCGNARKIKLIIDKINEVLTP